jgi:hypothetical protein
MVTPPTFIDRNHYNHRPTALENLSKSLSPLSNTTAPETVHTYTSWHTAGGISREYIVVDPKMP